MNKQEIREAAQLYRVFDRMNNPHFNYWWAHLDFFLLSDKTIDKLKMAIESVIINRLAELGAEVDISNRKP